MAERHSTASHPLDTWIVSFVNCLIRWEGGNAWVVKCTQAHPLVMTSYTYPALDTLNTGHRSVRALTCHHQNWFSSQGNLLRSLFNTLSSPQPWQQTHCIIRKKCSQPPFEDWKSIGPTGVYNYPYHWKLLLFILSLLLTESNVPTFPSFHFVLPTHAERLTVLLTALFSQKKVAVHLYLRGGEGERTSCSPYLL